MIPFRDNQKGEETENGGRQKKDLLRLSSDKEEQGRSDKKESGGMNPPGEMPSRSSTRK